METLLLIASALIVIAFKVLMAQFKERDKKELDVKVHSIILFILLAPVVLSNGFIAFWLFGMFNLSFTFWQSLVIITFVKLLLPTK